MLNHLRLLALICILATSAFAQYEQGAITGTVRDSQGGAIPEARVQIQHAGTGLIRSTISTSAGVFFLNGLPLGGYALVASHEGFGEARFTDIRVAVGQTRTVDVMLNLAARSDDVFVTARLSEIDQASAAVGTRMEHEQVAELPLNGRNWASMLPLMAGAVDPGTSDQRSVRFAGHGRDDNNFTLDGVDAGGISNQPQKTQIRLAIPTSSIAEFKVDSTLFPAETGVGSGAQIVIASSGGTNAYHGDLFEFLRTTSSMPAIRSRFRSSPFG